MLPIRSGSQNTSSNKDFLAGSKWIWRDRNDNLEFDKGLSGSRLRALRCEKHSCICIESLQWANGNRSNISTSLEIDWSKWLQAQTSDYLTQLKRPIIFLGLKIHVALNMLMKGWPIFGDEHLGMPTLHAEGAPCDGEITVPAVMERPSGKDANLHTQIKQRGLHLVSDSCRKPSRHAGGICILIPRSS